MMRVSRAVCVCVCVCVCIYVYIPACGSIQKFRAKSRWDLVAKVRPVPPSSSGRISVMGIHIVTASLQWKGALCVCMCVCGRVSESGYVHSFTMWLCGMYLYLYVHVCVNKGKYRPIYTHTLTYSNRNATASVHRHTASRT